MEKLYSFLYFTVILIHLFCCIFEKKKIRGLTKLMLMPLLLLIYLDICSDIAFHHKRSKLIINGILLGFQGDALLLINNTKCFLFGLLSFLLGHLLYITAFVRRLGDFSNYWLISLIEIIHFTIFTIGFMKFLVSGFKKEMKYYAFIYGFTLTILDSLAIYSVFRNCCYQTILILVGTLNFFISDSILAYHKFVRNINLGSFYIMGTYIVAQSCIAIGMAL